VLKNVASFAVFGLGVFLAGMTVLGFVQEAAEYFASLTGADVTRGFEVLGIMAALIGALALIARAKGMPWK